MTTQVSQIGQPNLLSISLFFTFIFITMLITYWAARKTKSTEDFYAAGRNISGFQNGLALAGDYMSAASFMGITGMIAFNGFDAMLYLVGWVVGWPFLLFFIAEPLRNLGKYTFSDVIAFRMKERPIRTATAFSSLVITILYMIAQLVGGGYLIKVMFGLSYEMAEVVVGCAMICYVIFGGMLATTWVQIVKAVLLLSGGIILALLSLSHFHFDPLELFSKAVEIRGAGVLSPGKVAMNPWDAISLGLALLLGTAGLPHILMRFYTVPDGKAARVSVFYASGFVGVFYLLTFLIGFAAMVLVGKEAIIGVDKGGNVAALMLAELVGGSGFLGFIAAVAFATILAVVAGLTLSGAAAISHDLWMNVIRKGKADPKEQVLGARIATLSLGVVSIVLGIMFKNQNIAFMVGLAFSVAASANLPALILAIFWKRGTTAGVVSSIVFGVVSSITFIYLSPTVQVDILGEASAWFPLRTPGLITIPGSFLVGIVVSLLTKDHGAIAKFSHLTRQMHLGEFVAEHKKLSQPDYDLPTLQGEKENEEKQLVSSPL